MADARTDTPHTFRTYLDATERDQLDARAATAEQERDDALQDRDEARQTAKDLYGTLKTIERERNEAIEARDVLRHRLDHYRAVAGRLRDQAAEAAGWEFIADQLTEQRNILRTKLDTLQPLITAAQTWRTWYGNTNPSYASACNDLAAAIDALPPSSVPSRRAQEEPASEEIRWAYRWLDADGNVLDGMDTRDNVRETAEDRARRLAANRPPSVPRGDVVRYRVVTTAEVVAAYPPEARP